MYCNCNVKAYLCGSVPVQNILFEPRHWVRGYAASASPTGLPEEGGVSKGPDRMTSGGGISAGNLRQTPPLVEALPSPPWDSVPLWIYGYQSGRLLVMHVFA